MDKKKKTIMWSDGWEDEGKYFFWEIMKTLEEICDGDDGGKSLLLDTRNLFRNSCCDEPTMWFSIHNYQLIFNNKRAQ